LKEASVFARPFDRLLCIAPIGCLFGCVDQPTSYLDEAIGAWTVAALDEASPLVDAFIGVAGIVSEVCPLTESDWELADAEGLLISEEAQEWFDFDASGSVSQSASRGDFLLSLTDGVALGGETVALSIEATSPTQSFEATLYKVSDEIRDAFVVSFSATNCDELSPVLLASLTVEANTLSGQALEVSFQDDDAAWRHTDGSFLPTAGTLTWTGDVQGSRVKLLTEDASTIDDGAWPALLESSTWSADTQLSLD